MDEENKPDEEIRPFPLYGMLFCGTIICIIGLYLHFTNTATSGIAKQRFGVGEGKVTITGVGAIVLGLMISIFPIYQLIKQRKIKE